MAENPLDAIHSGARVADAELGRKPPETEASNRAVRLFQVFEQDGGTHEAIKRFLGRGTNQEPVDLGTLSKVELVGLEQYVLERSHEESWQDDAQILVRKSIETRRDMDEASFEQEEDEPEPEIGAHEQSAGGEHAEKYKKEMQAVREMQQKLKTDLPKITIEPDVDFWRGQLGGWLAELQRFDDNVLKQPATKELIGDMAGVANQLEFLYRAPDATRLANEVNDLWIRTRQ